MVTVWVELGARARTGCEGSPGSTSSGSASWMYSEPSLAPVRYASKSCAALL